MSLGKTCQASPTDEPLVDGTFRAMRCTQAPTQFGLLCDSCWEMLSEAAKTKIAMLFITDCDPCQVTFGTLTEVRSGAVFTTSAIDRWKAIVRDKKVEP